MHDLDAKTSTALARQAEIAFARAPDGTTYIARQRVGYPFHVTVPFYLDRVPAGLPTLYLQSVSGGLYEGERIGLTVSAGPGAAAQVTTQASTLVHRAERLGVEQETTIRAEAGAFLEVLPDPLVLFPGARLSSRIDAVVAEDATLMVCDGFGQHDPAGRGGRFGRLASEIAVRRPDGTLLALDRFEASPDSTDIDPANGHAAHGMLLVVTAALPPEAVADALLRGLERHPACYAGASTLPSACGAAARILAPDGGTLKTTAAAAWTAAREALTGCAPGVRRK